MRYDEVACILKDYIYRQRPYVLYKLSYPDSLPGEEVYQNPPNGMNGFKGMTGFDMMKLLLACSMKGGRGNGGGE